jgi:excisionase family DNA binding protein
MQREWYTVDEVAELLGKRPYTVREWCREGRINARKRPERRGGAELWNISAAEVARYRDEGILPPVPDRNSGR